MHESRDALCDVYKIYSHGSMKSCLLLLASIEKLGGQKVNLENLTT